MAAIEDTFSWLMTSGAYDSLLPFFLIFTLTFAFLQKVQMFGQGDNKKFNVMIALILGLLVVVPHVTNSYPPGMDVVQIMLDALPNVLLWVVAIFALWLLLAALGLPVTFGESTAGLQGFLTIVSVIVIAIIFGYAAGWFPPQLDPLERFLDAIDAGVLQVILIVAIVIGVLAWLLADPKEAPSGGRNRNAADSVGDMFASIGKSLGNKKDK